MVDIPEDQLMRIPLKPGVKPDPHKVYPLGTQDRALVDETFDKLHDQGRMEWTTKPTPFTYPVFVVWKTIGKPGSPPQRKGRVIVDIRGLTRALYPIATQYLFSQT